MVVAPSGARHGPRGLRTGILRQLLDGSSGGGTGAQSKPVLICRNSYADVAG